MDEALKCILFSPFELAHNQFQILRIFCTSSVKWELNLPQQSIVNDTLSSMVRTKSRVSSLFINATDGGLKAKFVINS